MNHLEHEDGSPRRLASATVWQDVRRDVQAAFESVAGPFPTGERCPLAPQVEEEVDCGSYLRRLVTYAATPGGRTPAYLCVPKVCLLTERPPACRPAVLCLHGTGAF